MRYNGVIQVATRCGFPPPSKPRFGTHPLSRSGRFPINLGLAQDPERADSGSKKTDRFRIQNEPIHDLTLARFRIQNGPIQDPERTDSGSKTDRFRIQKRTDSRSDPGPIQDPKRTDSRSKTDWFRILAGPNRDFSSRMWKAKAKTKTVEFPAPEAQFYRYLCRASLCSDRAACG